MAYDPAADTQLDARIRPWVRMFLQNGIKTMRFFGDQSEGQKAVAVDQPHVLPICQLRQVWPMLDGKRTGPYWEITYFKKAN